MVPLRLLGDAAVKSYAALELVVINVALTLGLTWNARAACTCAYAHLTFVTSLLLVCDHSCMLLCCTDGARSSGHSHYQGSLTCMGPKYTLTLLVSTCSATQHEEQAAAHYAKACICISKHVEQHSLSHAYAAINPRALVCAIVQSGCEVYETQRSKAKLLAAQLTIQATSAGVKHHMHSRSPLQ
eukprot:3617-Heterococcus_DN1.PRE.1